MKDIERSLGKKYLGHFQNEDGSIAYDVTVGQVVYTDGSVGTVCRKRFKMFTRHNVRLHFYSGEPELVCPPMTHTIKR